MRLSWNEVRTRAAGFANEWKDAASEKRETQSFYKESFDVFGIRRRAVARYEAHVDPESSPHRQSIPEVVVDVEGMAADSIVCYRRPGEPVERVVGNRIIENCTPSERERSGGRRRALLTYGTEPSRNSFGRDGESPMGSREARYGRLDVSKGSEMKTENMLNIRRIRLIIALLLSVFIGIAHADPNVLLGEAIENAARLQSSLPTKERLATYENIFRSLDRIVSEHPSTDQAIKILSGQRIGNFDPQALRTAYVKELTGYYDTVCETSPSYSCLGFVSLETGTEQCASASSFEQIVEAHTNLKNAAKVFIGQRDNESYISLAMNSYRGCLKRSEFEATTFASDFFTSELLELLLQSNQTSLARAAIENMETPYFKFLGVLKLSDHEDRLFDQPFWNRMKRYIEESIPDEDGDAAMAKYAIMLSAIRRSSLPVEYGDVTETFPIHGMWRKMHEQRVKMGIAEPRSCDHVRSRTVVDMLTTLQAEIIGLSAERKGFISAQAPLLMISAADNAWDPLSACKKDGLYDYYLITYLHGQLLLDDPQVAAEFRRRSLRESFSDREQLAFFFDHFGATEEKLALLGPHDDIGNPFPRIRGGKILEREDARYFVFTKRVDFGDVCEASRILFEDLKGGDDFDLAIRYMINSPSVDPSVIYDCGDEDLELLLD